MRASRRRFVMAAAACSLAPAASPAAPRRVVFWRSKPPTGQGDETLRRMLAGHGFADADLDVRIVHSEASAELAGERARAVLDERPDVVFTAFSYRVKALQRHSATMPIVFFLAADPLEAGIVESYARPGRNATGAALLFRETTVKRLELARELVPAGRRAGLLAHFGIVETTSPGFFSHVEQAARALHWDVVRIDGARGPEALPAQLESLRPDVVLPVGTVPGGRVPLQRLAALQRERRFVLVGGDDGEPGVASYGPDANDHHARAVSLLARVLRGASPATLPVDRDTRFRLRIDRAAAANAGIEIPASLLLRADRVDG